MAQDATPAEGSTPDAPESTEGPEPTDTPTGDSKTFDADYVKQLRAEAARYRKEAQEAKSKASEYEDRDKSELEKLTGKLSKTEERAVNAETALLRFQVANEKKVPADAVDFLTGSSREDLEASADKLLSIVKTEAPTPEFDGGAREPAPEAKTPEQAHNETILRLAGLTPNT